MSILITPETKIIVQGITGDFGGRHAKLSLDYGTQVVAGVTPGKGGQFFEHGAHKVPIFNSVADAAKATGATVSVIFVPPPFAGDAILECVDAGLDLAVAITEGIPVKDMIRVKRAMQGSKTRLLGPNCPGVVTPGSGKDSHGGCRIGIALPATFTKRATSASSPAPAPSPTKPSSSSRRKTSARPPASASAATPSTAPATSTSSSSSTPTPIRTASS
jgi:succinyl-CoA synthetase alpha subunit